MSVSSEKKVCLVTGVGPGTGTALVRRFAAEGYRVAMLARSADRLAALEGEIENTRAYACDVIDTASLMSTLAQIKQDLAPPEIVVHNAVGGKFGTFLTVDPADLDRNFRVNVMALLHIARAVVPDMVEAGSGALLCTGNTSAYRGKANFAAFAPTKAAQRILLESIAREVGPKGVHAAYIAIDAVIDLPWTRELASGKPDDFFINPDDIATECFRIAHQPRSAWSFNVEIRPFGETW